MTPYLTSDENPRDRDLAQSIRDAVSLTLFLALTFTAFALIQILAMG